MTKPNPPAHCIKVCAASQVLENSKDPVWPGKITHVFHQHWRGRNLRKKTICGLENGTLDRPGQLHLTHS